MSKLILFLSLMLVFSNTAFINSSQGEMPASSAITYDQNIAKSLCYLTVSSYCNPNQFKDWSCKPCKSSKINLGNVQTFLNSSGDILGIIGTSPEYRAIVLVFRGTVILDIKNWIQDINFVPTSYPLCDNGCKVHQGFYGAYLQIQQKVKATVQLYQKNFNLQSLIITGHSLGGALATFAAADMIKQGNNVIHFYTYGSPRVGDPSFAAWMELNFGIKPRFRVTHGRDPVPHLPPYESNFKHITNQVFYDEFPFSTSAKVCDDSKGQDPKCSNKYLASVNVLDHLSYLGIDYLLACQ